MSGHHGHHRSSHHSRSRMHHSSSHYSSMHNRSRTSSSNAMTDIGSSSNHRSVHQDNNRGESASASDWQEHKSSSGKVYYYNPRTGVSQWEVPVELRQHQHQQQQRPASPESDLSESSSIRQQENSPSSSTSSHQSAQSESITEDKPLLTPSLALFYKPELIHESLNSSQGEDLQQQSDKLDREILVLNESLLKQRVEIKICKSALEYATTQVEAHRTKCDILKKTIKEFERPNYQ